MSDIVDLDALAPQPVTVKINQPEYSIKPPSLQDVMLLGGISQKMSKFDGENLAEASEVIAELTEQIFKCAPELRDISLNTTQIMTLVRVITEMATPPDTKELEKRGISTDDPKAPSA